MSVGVDVDLGSAVISYRPAAGEERCLSAEAGVADHDVRMRSAGLDLVHRQILT